jgi:phosphoribosylformylglycinamidine (FGAM) synthase-like enzyme
MSINTRRAVSIECDMQVGNEVPDVAASALKGAWEATQQLLWQRKISAGHDISDGGLVTALLEMSFSGNTGILVSVQPAACVTVQFTLVPLMMLSHDMSAEVSIPVRRSTG